MLPYQPFPYPYLNVFYYVYTEGGFGAAARAMHLTQPTVSSHIKDFEHQLGDIVLFERQPFRRTPIADMLFQEHAEPAVKSMEAFQRKMQAMKEGPVLRIGASEFILQYYLMPVLEIIERRLPNLRYELRSGTRMELTKALRHNQADLVVAALDEPPAEFHHEPLVPLPVMLFVPSTSNIHDVDTLLRHTGTHRLIAPHRGEAATQRLEQFLRDREIYWPVAKVASSTGLVPIMVGSGMGVGVSVGASAVLRHTTIRGLPLPGVAPVTVAALWREITPGLQEFLGLVGRTARVLTAAKGVGPGPASITPEAALAALKAVAASAPAPESPVTRKQK